MYEYTARARRLPQLLLFAGFAAWYFGSEALASRAANGFSGRFGLVAGRLVLEACFHLFLLILGFAALQAMARQAVPVGELLALPRRKSAGREWSLGLAIGWGMVVAALLPLILAAKMHVHLIGQADAIGGTLLGVVAIGIGALTAEIAFRGYPFRCLIGAVGPTMAVILMMAGAGFAEWRDPFGSSAAVLAAMLVTLILSLGWVRTHGVWMSWGLHFGLVAALGVLFGMPVGGGMAAETGRPAAVQGSTGGPEWLTGGDFGPEAGLFSLLVLLGSVAVVVRSTRDYAWNYTYAPILPGGYEVTIAPPAVHTAMEEQAKAPGLVQILPTTPQSFSAERPATGAPPPPMPDRLH
jgi:hypothetical protein